ncbi:hypothetical protein [Natrononativus amylolyticus]|uniref:hypothetical protein n=1 Tax=Natrononativus amylolyticus TaxID=2963434 RepID=UPI0020CE06EF|nr:hypothetical protein [Natrononativus amylolyticus]
MSNPDFESLADKLDYQPPSLNVGDHVRDREEPSQLLLVAQHTATPAAEYCLGETTTTVADVNPAYDPTDEVLLVAYPHSGAADLADLTMGPIPRGRLELVTRFQGGPQ